jgi:hypothetical protein
LANIYWITLLFPSTMLASSASHVVWSLTNILDKLMLDEHFISGDIACQCIVQQCGRFIITYFISGGGGGQDHHGDWMLSFVDF